MNEISNITLAARGQWSAILPQLGICLPKGRRHGPCPVCGGKDRFRFDDQEGRGTFICNQCGAGDGLDLVRLVAGKGALEAAQDVAAALGLDSRQIDPEAVERNRRKAEDHARAEAALVERKRQQAAQRAATIMQDAQPGTSHYLAGKGLPTEARTLQQEITVGDAAFTPGALVLPLLNEDGGLVNVQLIDGGGNKRYLPGGQKAGAYHLLAGQEPEPVCIAEGLATALSVQQITGGPVYVALDAGNLDAVTAIAKRQHPGKALIITADHDDNGTGQRKASEAARRHGALIALPPEPGDWDDYRQAHGPERSAEAFALATQTVDEFGADEPEPEAEQPKPRPYTDILAEAETLSPDSDPATVERLALEAGALGKVEAERILKAIKKRTGINLGTLREIINDAGPEAEQEDHLTLARKVLAAVGRENIFATGPFVYGWEVRGVWRPMEEREVKQIVQTALEKQTAITASTVGNVADVFRTDIYIKDVALNQGDPETVNTPGGELVLDAGQWELRPHNRDAYRTTQIPIAYDPAATAPRFAQFLDEIFQPDADRGQKKECLLQLMGYSLMTHCRHEKFVMLIGNGSNGKSVLLSVLEALLGTENVAGVQPSMFDRTFQRAHLHMKLANIVTEIREGEVIADAELKGIVSGEPATVENKFQTPFVMRPYATCWFGTNHMPHTRDFSDALFRRAVILTFNRKFNAEHGETDPMLKETLINELPGILNMALHAYARWIVTGVFAEPESSRDAKHNWRLEADQVAQFVEERCIKDPEGMIGSQALYDNFNQWVAEQGISRKVTQKSFVGRLERLGYGRRKTNAGARIIGLRPGLQ